MQRSLLSALFAATALVPAAMAQTDQETTTVDARACEELVVFVRDNNTADTGIGEEQAERIAEQGDARTCDDALRVARGEISQREGEENFDAEATARLRVMVPEPEVTVEQAPPQVTVQQAQPQVTVDPGRPVVTVDQAEPVVNVEIRPPRITIDLPKPRITVEMPDPTVDVAMAQPRVTVDQPEPRVNVEQGEVEVQVGDTSSATEQDGEAQINVQQEQAQVTLQRTRSEEANVQISESRPEVRYNAAEPRIQVQQAGDPEIEFSHSGETDVSFRQMSADETREAADRQNRDMQMNAAVGEAEEQTAAASLEGEQEATLNERMSFVQSDRTDTTATDRDMQSVTIENLLDMEVIGADGESIGDVEDVVLYNDGAYVIVGNGGFLGIGEREVALSIDDMFIRDGQIILRSITEDRVEQMQEVDADDFQSYAREDTLEVGRE